MSAAPAFLPRDIGAIGPLTSAPSWGDVAEGPPMSRGRREFLWSLFEQIRFRSAGKRPMDSPTSASTSCDICLDVVRHRRGCRARTAPVSCNVGDVGADVAALRRHRHRRRRALGSRRRCRTASSPMSHEIVGVRAHVADVTEAVPYRRRGRGCRARVATRTEFGDRA
jgi:hypothetical protein